MSRSPLPFPWAGKKEDVDKSLTLARNMCTPTPCTRVHIHMCVCVVNSRKLLHIYMSTLKTSPRQLREHHAREEES